ncbi:phosphoglycolate phosphatase [Ectothiorhodospira mobilis]|uniref:Phosphoglycolate phosphatase n=1 Tax=Ectothiorhodospira mobilis TaxID=195064 RepID=A0A1I4PNI4_ECTMO|nr:HAD-IA family hydrolase [Ectothiorhodospira mobilis]SFM29013.1 phosphoglycolate phosphatase [Ectothiorhodospira mobilis]
MQTLLLDLDGTLADTAPDMHAALCRLQTRHGVDPLPFEAVRDHVSHGSVALVRLGFPGIEGETFEDLKRQYLDLYAQALHVETRLFPGMAKILEGIEARGMNWGVVTNKPGWLTDPLLRAMGLYERAATVISGDTTPERKPHPLPLLQACREAGSTPQRCLYIGDALRDIQAGRAAGMVTLTALYGYIDADQTPDTWGADGCIRHPEEILPWLSPVHRAS